MSTPSLFDAFFWIEPVKGSSKNSNSTRVLWNYPDDVSNVVEEFKEIPDFCFPDLARVALEKAQNARSEHYTFTLTDSSGKRVYGICMRALFRGMTRRYDVKRRVRHCLCVITRYPFFKFFNSMLMELHAVAMLEERPGCCRQFIDCVYRLADPSVVGEQQMTIPAGTISAMYYEYSLIRPKMIAGAGMGSKEVPVLPLFDSLGTERFFKLLSAVLCERRIVFIADEAETLSATVLAAANMLTPFNWPHMFIPLLPGRLLGLLQNQSPYMIGVRKYLLAELRRDALDGTVVVDCDSGEVRLQGQVHVRDLIGDAASASKRAAESIDQMKAKMSAMFMGKASDGPQDTGPKDLMVVLLSDLKSNVTSNKPSNYTISSLLSGGGHNRSVEEAKMQWALDAERALRDSLTVFFVYFFADLEEFMSPSAVAGGATSLGGGFGTLVKGGEPGPAKRMSSMGSEGSASSLPSNPSSADLRFAADDSRSHFDLKGYLNKRTQMGDSRQLVVFLQDFVQSQIFEKFCSELVARKQAQTARLTELNRHKSMSAAGVSALSGAGGRGGVQSLPGALNSSGGASGGADEEVDEDDTYERAVREWGQRGAPLTIASVKQAVSAVSPSSGAGKEMNSNFHSLTVQFTSSSTALAPCEMDLDRDNTYYTSHLGASNQSSVDSQQNRDSAKRQASAEAMMRRIISDASESDDFQSIMRTLHFRLQACHAAGSRGSAGTSGVRALILCRSLLVEGPECVLTYSTDFIPVIRGILSLAKPLQSSGSAGGKKSKQQQALDYMSLGAFVDPTVHAQTVLDLIVDHKKLLVQRKVCLLLKRGSFPFLTAYANGELRAAQYTRTEMFFSAQYSSAKLFPRFDALHQSMNQAAAPPIAEGVLQLTPPELAVGAVEDRQNGGDDDDDAPTGNYPRKESTGGAQSPGRAQPVVEALPPAPPSALAAFGKPVRPGRPGQEAAPRPVVKERFIYSDEDDAPGHSGSRPSSTSSLTAATAAPAAGPPGKPVRPESTSRSESPFKQEASKPTTAPAAPAAPAAGIASSKVSPFATGAAGTTSDPATRRQSTAGAKLTPLPDLKAKAAAPPPDLLNMDMLVAPSTFSADPFAADPFTPSFPGTSAPVSDPFAASAFSPSVPAASFTPTAASHAVDPFAPTTATAFAPTKADAFAPSTAWGGPSSFASSDPFAPSASAAAFTPTTGAAFAPSTSSSPAFAPSPSAGFAPSFPGSSNGAAVASPFDSFAPTPPSGRVAADPFAPTVAGAGFQPSASKVATDPFASFAPTTAPSGTGAAGGRSGVMMPPPSGQANPNFIYAKPPQGANPAASKDPFDFLNPIKK